MGQHSTTMAFHFQPVLRTAAKVAALKVTFAVSLGIVSLSRKPATLKGRCVLSAGHIRCSAPAALMIWAGSSNTDNYVSVHPSIAVTVDIASWAPYMQSGKISIALAVTSCR